jgi:hypothetical protein
MKIRFIPGLDDLTTREERKEMAKHTAFRIGRLAMTRTAEEQAKTTFGEGQWTRILGELLSRHVMGDWGDLNDAGKKVNDHAAEHGGRILSAYVEGGVEFWIITEADRSVTTILLPHDY